MRNTRLRRADSVLSSVARSKPPVTPSSPSSTRALSRSVWSLPRNHVPVFDKRLVVEIHRVLRGQHDAHAERACLLEQREERRLRRRVGDRAAGSRTLRPCRAAPAGTRCPSDGASTRAAALSTSDTTSIRSASPRCAIEDHRDGRPPGGVVEHRAHVERDAVEPHVEAGRGQHAVEAQRQLLPFLGGVVGFQVQHADAVERGLLNLLHQPRQIRRGRRRRGCEDGRQERQLAVVRAHLRDSRPARAGSPQCW